MSLTWRYRLEIVLGALATVMCAATAVWPAWIEAVFGADPDHGGGWLEWLIVAALAIAAVSCGWLARADRRSMRRMGAESSVVAQGTGA